MKTLKLSCLILLLTVAVSVMAQTKDAAAPHVDLISIDGTINPAVDDFIRESIARAKAGGAKAKSEAASTPGRKILASEFIRRTPTSLPSGEVASVIAQEWFIFGSP